MNAAREHKSASPGRFAYDGLDRVMHEKARLGLLTSLASRAEGLSFSDLKELCALTDGNLNRHLQVLREAGLVEVRKDARAKRPQTLCRLTDQGRRKFAEYLEVLEQVVTDSLAAQRSAAAKPKRARPGWSGV